MTRPSSERLEEIREFYKRQPMSPLVKDLFAEINSLNNLIEKINSLNNLIEKLRPHTQHDAFACYWLEPEDRWHCKCGLSKILDALDEKGEK